MHPVQLKPLIPSVSEAISCFGVFFIQEKYQDVSSLTSLTWWKLGLTVSTKHSGDLARNARNSPSRMTIWTNHQKCSMSENMYSLYSIMPDYTLYHTNSISMPSMLNGFFGLERTSGAATTCMKRFRCRPQDMWGNLTALAWRWDNMGQRGHPSLLLPRLQEDRQHDHCDCDWWK